MKVESHEPENETQSAAQELNENDNDASSSIWLHFEVKDTGVGIAPDEMDKVFEAFAQTESGQQLRQGTGLGLPISREYVRMMGGDLTIQSTIGEGTVFAFDIEAEIVDDSEIEPEQSSHHVIGLEPGQPTHRILIAEDDEASRLLLVKLLVPLGFEIQQAIDGEQTLDIWEDWQPHLIFMDMRMPKLDGNKTTKEIKSRIQHDATYTNTIIIALTASAFEEDRESVLANGCDDFIRKPYREASIIEALAQHLNVRFIYEERVLDKHTSITEELPQPVKALPADWVTEMQQATLQGDLERMEKLITQLHPSHTALAAQLAELAYNFEHEAILELIQQDIGGNP